MTYLHFFKGLLHVLNRIGYQHHILFFYHERSTMLYNNIIKNRKVYVAWTHGHVGLKQWVFFFWLFFVFRVRLREHFRLFIVLAVYHEKITKQNKRASCKKNKKKKRQRNPHWMSKVGEVLESEKHCLTVAENAWDYLRNNGDPRKYKSMPYA